MIRKIYEPTYEGAHWRIKNKK